MAKSLPVMHHLNLKREEICKLLLYFGSISRLSWAKCIGSHFHFEFRPVKYDRKLMEDTVEAVKRVTEIRKKREGSYSITFHTHNQLYFIVFQRSEMNLEHV